MVMQDIAGAETLRSRYIVGRILSKFMLMMHDIEDDNEEVDVGMMILRMMHIINDDVEDVDDSIEDVEIDVE